MKHCKPLNVCLACNNRDLKLVLDLGTQALANEYLKDPKIEQKKYPLAINVCQKCYHVQLTHIVDPEIIYENYAYVSGTTKTYRDYMEWFASLVDEYYSDASYILDIGCNDGTQLDYFASLGYDTFGIDPAANLYPISSAKHRVECNYFDNNYKNETSFDVIISQNSFAHNPDPYNFLLTCKNNLDNNGKIFIQTSQADMIKNGEFDAIYHEHISYYNTNSMDQLCTRAGLYLIDVIKTPIHGISYIFVISKNYQDSSYYKIRNIIEMERLDGLYDISLYYQFGEKAKNIKEKFKNSIKIFRENPKSKIIGYGAAAKGMTFLNYTNVLLDYIIDDNPLKQNTFTPGTKIPIYPNEKLNELEYYDEVLFVPLAWNFYDEIRNKINNLREKSFVNNRFIKYFPKVTVEN